MITEIGDPKKTRQKLRKGARQVIQFIEGALCSRTREIVSLEFAVEGGFVTFDDGGPVIRQESTVDTTITLRMSVHNRS